MENQNLPAFPQNAEEQASEERLNEPADLHEAAPVPRKPHKRVSLPVYLCSLLLAVVLTATGIFVWQGSGIAKTVLKLVELNGIVSRNYSGEWDYDKLDNGIMNGYVDGLGDKYAFYASTKDAAAVSDSFEGNAHGIGVTVVYDQTNKNMYVLLVDNGGPAKKAGLQIGDRIVAVDGKRVSDLGYAESMKALQKEVGEQAVVTLQRGGKEQTAEINYIEFVRQSVYYHTVGQYGYMRFTGFNAATVTQFKDALADLQSSGVRGLIFDLRDNGGGTVDSVSTILDPLLDKCDIISVEYASGKKQVLFTSDEQQLQLPMTVLVNENTASAAELFAAAIRDREKGILIGTKTYGKGVMQRTYFLRDKSCVRMTVAKFFPPCGECFDGKGLIPDKTVTYTQAQAGMKYTLGDADPHIVQAVAWLDGMVGKGSK